MGHRCNYWPSHRRRNCRSRVLALGILVQLTSLRPFSHHRFSFRNTQTYFERTDSFRPEATGCVWMFSFHRISYLFLDVQGGTRYEWSHFRTFIPIQMGILGLFLFGLWTWLSPVVSMLNIGMFLERNSIPTYFGAVVQGMIVSMASYFLVSFFQIFSIKISES